MVQHTRRSCDHLSKSELLKWVQHTFGAADGEKQHSDLLLAGLEHRSTSKADMESDAMSSDSAGSDAEGGAVGETELGH